MIVGSRVQHKQNSEATGTILSLEGDTHATVEYDRGMGVRPRQLLTLLSPLVKKTAAKIVVLDGAKTQSFLQAHKDSATLVVMIRSEEQRERVKEEYRSWCGEELQDCFIRACLDKNFADHGRQWFLTFRAQPCVDYPFALAERGTGAKKRQGFGWKSKAGDFVEYCYAAGIAALVRSGLRAQRTNTLTHTVAQ